jgi:cytoskeletal protein CcmA (bactofilin family)
MLGRSNPEPHDLERAEVGINTIIGRGCAFEGIFTVQSSLRVDGKLKGTVGVNGSLIVGKEGEIDGEVRARDVIIGGKVKNKILASGKVTLEAKSVVQGELCTTRLVIDEGAIFEGKCSMSENGKVLALPNRTSRGERPEDARGVRSFAAQSSHLVNNGAP